jgi:hypothetical protein
MYGLSGDPDGGCDAVGDRDDVPGPGRSPVHGPAGAMPALMITKALV